MFYTYQPIINLTTFSMKNLDLKTLNVQALSVKDMTAQQGGSAGQDLLKPIFMAGISLLTNITFGIFRSCC